MVRHPTAAPRSARFPQVSHGYSNLAVDVKVLRRLLSGPTLHARLVSSQTPSRANGFSQVLSSVVSLVHLNLIFHCARAFNFPPSGILILPLFPFLIPPRLAFPLHLRSQSLTDSRNHSCFFPQRIRSTLNCSSVLP